jgi:hypothetical protein
VVLHLLGAPLYVPLAAVDYEAVSSSSARRSSSRVQGRVQGRSGPGYFWMEKTHCPCSPVRLPLHGLVTPLSAHPAVLQSPLGSRCQQ